MLMPRENSLIIDRKSWPKDRRWVIGIATISIVATIGYLYEWVSVASLPGGSSRSGFLYGIVAGLIIAFELLLWPRKHVRSWRIGSAQQWLRAHVWLGLLSVPLVLMHAKLLFIGGLLNWAIMITFLIVIASGIWGLVLQQFLPRMLLEQVPAETIYDQVDHVASQQCKETERLVKATCEPGIQALHWDKEHLHENLSEQSAEDDNDDPGFVVVTGFRSMTGIQGKVLDTVPVYKTIQGTQSISNHFFSEIRPYLKTGRRSDSLLVSPMETSRLMAKLRATCPTEASFVIDHLEHVCTMRRQLDFQIRIHHWLHGWLLVHVPLSVALGILLLIHVPVALMYW